MLGIKQRYKAGDERFLGFAKQDAIEGLGPERQALRRTRDIALYLHLERFGDERSQ
jgi:hypothetical protein